MPDRVPTATYRLQLHPGFGFRAAAGQARYLADLGISHAYLSPILQAVPGSKHGYDVIDHSVVSADLGGEQEFRAMAAAFADRDIGVVADVVPNHMAIPVPEFLNRQLWSVLRDGPDSPVAYWFDVDWAAADGRMLLPILARPLRYCLDDFRVTRLSALPGTTSRQLRADLPDDEVLQYHGHVLPLRPGTAGLELGELLAAQCYRLDSWRAAAATLNWRRFFDITSLIAIRAEDPRVFEATHAVLVRLVGDGIISGLRIDHPDGLADPRGYLDRLSAATGGSWVAAEKILGADEQLPADWRCAGTTGYDSLAAVGALFTDPAGIEPLGHEYARFTGGPGEFGTVAWTARREVAGHELTAEVARLARLARRADEPALRRVDAADLRFVLAELLAAFEVYRTYVVPGAAPPDSAARRISQAADRARRRMPRRLQPALDLIAALLLGRGVPERGQAARDRMVTVFQQTCAAIQAKGVEDTAMYRWPRLLSANEVGADPARPAAGLAEFHAFAGRLARDWPATMTTLSTHDTKRQEDVRARLAVLAEYPEAWACEVDAWHARAHELSGGQLPDPDTEYLLWQTLAGSWPIGEDRLTGYLRKAMREAKTRTSWLDPDSGYESAVLDLARSVLSDDTLAARISAFVTQIIPDAITNSLGAKLVQLTMPGVPDLYQGCELGAFSLVDPDNRRPVDFVRRREMLAALGGISAGVAQRPGGRPADAPGSAVARTSLDAGKLLVSSRALRLRRARPAWFAGGYEPLTAAGPGRAHAVAFARSGRCITLATRLPAGLRREGGWQDTTLRLPAGQWRDVLTGAGHEGGDVPLAVLTAALPVALLARPARAAGA